MVDVKKVTALVKKPKYYSNASTNVTDEVIDFDPTNNPIFPETNNTVYTIDPFAVFIRESNSLKVKIPFTRFYRLKCAIELTNVYTAVTPVSPDYFSISKPILACLESVKIIRTSGVSVTTVQTNIFKQDGSGFLVYNPVGSPISGYDVQKSISPAIVEGIVELYAGDILTFQHSRVIIPQVKVNGIIGSLGLKTNIFPPPAPYDDYWNLADFRMPSSDPAASGEPLINIQNIHRSDAGFFFEISEITDL